VRSLADAQTAFEHWSGPWKVPLEEEYPAGKSIGIRQVEGMLDCLSHLNSFLAPGGRLGKRAHLGQAPRQ
jgi:hypothetical protein